jgi:hypothetical protein
LVSSLECIAAESQAANLTAPALVVIGDIVGTRQHILDARTDCELRAASVPDAAAPLPHAGSPCES